MTTNDSSSACVRFAISTSNPWFCKIDIISSTSFCAYATTRKVPPFGRSHDLISPRIRSRTSRPQRPPAHAAVIAGR